MITGCGSVGKLNNCEIYRITNVAMISLRGYQPGNRTQCGNFKILREINFGESRSSKTAVFANLLMPFC